MKRPAVLWLVLVLGAGACSGAEDGTVEPSRAEPYEVGEADAAPAQGRPKAREADPADRELVHRAEDQLLIGCMQTAGFERYPEPFRGQDPFAVGGMTPPLNLYLLSEERAASGFDVESYDPRDSDIEADANIRYLEGLPEERQALYIEALHGAHGDVIAVEPVEGGPIELIGGRGCLAEARLRLFGDLSEFMRLASLNDSIEGEAWNRMTARREFSLATQAWSSCVQSAGYAATDPFELEERALGTDAELQAARAHASCLTSSGLRDVVDAGFTEMVESVRREREGELVAFAELRQRAVEEAKAVLASEGVP